MRKYNSVLKSFQIVGTKPQVTHYLDRFASEVCFPIFSLKFPSTKGFSGFSTLSLNLNNKAVSFFTRLQALLLLAYLSFSSPLLSNSVQYEKKVFSMVARLRGKRFFMFLAFLQSLVRVGDIDLNFSDFRFSNRGGVSFSLSDVASYVNLGKLSFDYFNWALPINVNLGFVGLTNNVQVLVILRLLGIFR